MGYKRAEWHSGLTYRQTCEMCKTIVEYQDFKLGFRPWYPDGFVYCPTCKKPLRHNENYAINTNPAPVVKEARGEHAAPIAQAVVNAPAAPAEPVFIPDDKPAAPEAFAPQEAAAAGPVVFIPDDEPAPQAAFVPQSAPAAGLAAFCSQCGKAFRDGDKFCSGCGSKRD